MVKLLFQQLKHKKLKVGINLEKAYEDNESILEKLHQNVKVV